MTESWNLKSIDEIAEIGRGRSRHRPRNAPELYGGVYPFVQTADIHASDLYINTFSKTYNEAGLAQSKLWDSGVICITNAGENTGDCAILGIQACVPDSIITVIPDPEETDPVFLKYAIDQLKSQLRAVTKGATQDNLSIAKLTVFKFQVPSVATQKQVGHILRCYGDLIENNRRRIQLLERSLHLLYKEWFVHLRFPSHEHSKIVDGIPEGWGKLSLAHFCAEIKVSINPKEIPSETPYIGLEHIPRRSVTLSDWGTAAEVDSQKFGFKTGDILFGKIRPYFHKVGFTLIDGIASSDAVVIRPIESKFYCYCLLLVSSDEFISLASKTMREGSKMPRADWKYLSTCEFLIPPSELLYSFNEVCFKVINQLQNLALQNRQLQQARDLLLPKLMSGAIGV